MATKRGQKPGPAVPVSNGKAPTNAWARPLKTTGPPPGLVAADPSRAAATTGNKATTVYKKGGNGSSSSITSYIHRERLLHLSLTLIGQKVVVTLTDDTVLEGIFHTFTPLDGVEPSMKNKYVLTAVLVVKAGKDNKIENGSTAILAVEKVSSLYAKNINLDRPNQNGAAKGAKGEFVTDTQISASKTAGGKDLVAAGSAWTTGGKQTRAEALAGALGSTGTRETSSGLKGSIGKWDQFEANKELFNVNASFDENLYTTKLDKSQIDAGKIAEAERLAREIENTPSSNIHIREERGHADETDYDEEDRYSGVLTKDGKQRHEATEKAIASPKMNYAAAAAKADAASKKPAPVPVETKPIKAVEEEVEKKEEPKPEVVEVKKEEKPVETPEEVAPVPDTKEEEIKESEENKEEKVEVKKPSKLNANAKEFTFNPSAKSFTPSFVATMPMPHMDPFHMPGSHPMQPHFIPQMGQPGMMTPMMNPPYPGMRYPQQYPAMDPGGPPMQPLQPQQPIAGVKPGATAPGMPSTGLVVPTPPPGGEADSSGTIPPQEGESSQPAPAIQGPQSQQQPPHQQPMSVPYNMQQRAYFPGGGMPVHPGPGGYPQFAGGPQQIPVPQGYGRGMYHMQPGSMAPNMIPRPGGGAPYYASPGGPVPYPPNTYGHGMVEDDGGYRGGRVPGRGRGRGRGRGGGRGRGPQFQQQGYGTGANGQTSQQHGGLDQDGGPSTQGDEGEGQM